ncbi:MAG: ABC transporter substrate-binding protein [Vulcanimicrobiaceae bacterium]
MQHRALMQHAIRLASALCLLALGGTFFSAAAAPRDELRLVVAAGPHSLDPLLGTTAEEGALAGLAFDDLLFVEPDGRFAPDLAREVPSLRNGDISPDGRRIVFRLRKGVRWQDGVPLTSADVAYTIRTILDPHLAISVRSGYDDIASLQTPDRWTVVFTLKHAYAPFVATVGTQYPIVPQHVLAKAGNVMQAPFNGQPLGSGPYEFVRWIRGDRIEYVANPHYWGGPPKIPKVTVLEIPDVTTIALELRSGALDYAPLESSQFAQLRHDPSLVAQITPNNDFVAYALNLQRPVLRDVRLRRAISMAIDRVALVRDVTFGTGEVAYADLPAFMWTHAVPRNPYGYDPAAANALLERAGWRRGTDGVRERDGHRLALTLIDFSGSVSGHTIDVEVQQMLAAVGIATELKYYAPSLYFGPAADGGPLYLGEFDLAAFQFVAGNDPLNDFLYRCANAAPNGFNAARYCSPKMEALQAASLRELDPVKRLALVAKIEQLAATDVPYVFLYHTPWRVVHTPSLRDAGPTLGSEWNQVNRWSFAP